MKELIEIQQRLKAPKDKYNSVFRFNYRSAESILENLKPLLSELNCTLTLSDEIVPVLNTLFVKATATLKNSSGEVEVTTAFAGHELSKKGSDIAQISGAASSYARKYALNGLFCIDDTKDADTDEYTKQHEAQAQNYEKDIVNLIARVGKCNSMDDLMNLRNGNMAYAQDQRFRDALNARAQMLRTA